MYINRHIHLNSVTYLIFTGVTVSSIGNVEILSHVYVNTVFII